MEESVPILLIIEDKTLVLYLKAIIAKSFPQALIFVSEDGWDGWEIVVNNKPKLIISDLNIPGMNGIQICKKLREVSEFKETYFIILTAIVEKAQRSLALQEGADDFINKPFVEEELKTKLGVAFRIIELQNKMTDDSQLVHDIADQLQQDIKDFLNLSLKFCQSRFPASLEMFRRISEASKWIAISFGDIEEDEIYDIETAALLSYTGKIFLPDTMLKTQVLVDGVPSNNLMYQVPVFAHEILSSARILKQAAKILYHIHENFDGSGIPEHIKSWQIPIGSRIIRVALDYEELRAFRKIPPQTIIEKLHTESKRLYDQRVVILMEQYIASRGGIEGILKEKAIMLNEMLEGMSLTRDVYTNSGIKIVSAGAVLNGSLIDKIVAHNSSDPILGLLFVRE
ncbi:MAG: hypothetical protein A2X61_06515 [Ignavibacteria bacterium GWB2_35_12]|nr:MAG: hypothetical protein A2X63_06030 [Ignavibacteria bacterium GWA2_35_8]OGU40975.1 MAG: hypothetical protein A2X61_06515 [Ignavibacteria bacterium GWB2_35_12]OGV19736.1 MAG: hypothetical protein A2475_00540 [Ignavibacteria bacterium RIFOXYC2_FULL_35_21]OGV23634.1 MAG: hypothetical protein A3J84_07075 [Ignavibacteria bacterium RIFOXYA2_FULL_37_17]